MLLAGPGKLLLDALLFGRKRAATPNEVRAVGRSLVNNSAVTKEEHT